MKLVKKNYIDDFNDKIMDIIKTNLKIGCNHYIAIFRD
jgi:hypothetical protein